jgi:uncharacterized low-complexity protein
MKSKTMVGPMAAAISATLLGSLASASAAAGDQNPFGLTSLSSGYTVAFSGRKDEEAEGKCGEGKQAEGSDEQKGAHEGNCGEGKAKEGSCGEGKAHEGSCGEGKAGGTQTAPQ